MNVRNIIGDAPPKEKTIADLEFGESGYTVPWAYNRDLNHLNTSFSIGKKGGTASLWVECCGENEYVLEFENPVYRDILKS